MKKRIPDASRLHYWEEIKKKNRCLPDRANLHDGMCNCMKPVFMRPGAGIRYCLPADSGFKKKLKVLSFDFLLSVFYLQFCVVEGTVGTVQFQKFLMCTLFHNLSLVNNHDDVSILNGG